MGISAQHCKSAILQLKRSGNKWNRDQKTPEKINKTKRSFFEKINRIDKTLARHINKKWERAPINKI